MQLIHAEWAYTYVEQTYPSLDSFSAFVVALLFDINMSRDVFGCPGNVASKTPMSKRPTEKHLTPDKRADKKHKESPGRPKTKVYFQSENFPTFFILTKLYKAGQVEGQFGKEMEQEKFSAERKHDMLLCARKLH